MSKKDCTKCARGRKAAYEAGADMGFWKAAGVRLGDKVPSEHNASKKASTKAPLTPQSDTKDTGGSDE